MTCERGGDQLGEVDHSSMDHYDPLHQPEKTLQIRPVPIQAIEDDFEITEGPTMLFLHRCKSGRFNEPLLLAGEAEPPLIASKGDGTMLDSIARRHRAPLTELLLSRHLPCRDQTPNQRPGEPQQEKIWAEAGIHRIRVGISALVQK